MKAIKISKSPDNAIRDLLRYLFDKKKITGAFALTKIEGQGYSYALISNKELLNNISPTAPLMPANAGKLVSRLTMIEPVASPIAVVVRPCELRALYELVKLEQAKLDNLLFISFTCSGVLPIKEMKDGAGSVDTSSDSGRLRECCQICENFIPDNADIILPLVGKINDKECSVLIKTEKGEEFIEGMEGQFAEDELNLEELESIRNRRIERKKQTFAAIKSENLGIKGLINIFGRCINCHACSKACPICYCNLCYFESEESESSPSVFEVELEKRGALRLPSNTIFYHIGRMIHVSLSCVGCGMCSDVCPVDIPVGTIFTKIAESGQKLFDYLPGKDLEEKIPTSTFEIEELKELGEK